MHPPSQPIADPPSAGKPPFAEPVGLHLRRARLQCGLTLQDISRTTRISVSQLDYLERDRFEDLPGNLYTRGFIRSFAKAVGLDGELAVAHYTSNRRCRSISLFPAQNHVEKKRRGLGIFVACSAFLLLIVVATLAVSHAKPKNAGRLLSFSALTHPGERPPSLA
ncbi:MAG TPA: helix-turn-helix transcriptional regulator [Polyangiaceae bacterium]|nr:MAG: cytoskeletal protein RodZ [Deltaproteobacteria bacterium ADurb.Bin207]HNS98498.1 helix-turn-helix transcriptional regulator [Polyangiaceae bacterium]HNZ23956.1 helix-turn-helix transcriptional regulator [Polyangiaceae bacterium]HOD21793.1 helix-turn-helix transcriptional regulator [Polyangiaceae bacterium]HOE49503.1 helix-turn-helix transcriptional regulator [Polyangiaceae bacterium]